MQDDYSWTNCYYADIDETYGLSLLLFQTMTSSGQTFLIYDGGARMNSLFLSMLYFDIFYFLSMMIISSLFKGIVLEIFTVIDNNIESID